jgi:hypothetical protein
MPGNDFQPHKFFFVGSLIASYYLSFDPHQQAGTSERVRRQLSAELRSLRLLDVAEDGLQKIRRMGRSAHTRRFNETVELFRTIFVELQASFGSREAGFCELGYLAVFLITSFQRPQECAELRDIISRRLETDFCSYLNEQLVTNISSIFTVEECGAWYIRVDQHVEAAKFPAGDSFEARTRDGILILEPNISGIGIRLKPLWELITGCLK